MILKAGLCAVLFAAFPANGGIQAKPAELPPCHRSTDQDKPVKENCCKAVEAIEINALAVSQIIPIVAPVGDFAITPIVSHSESPWIMAYKPPPAQLFLQFRSFLI